jgi:Fic family protein
MQVISGPYGRETVHFEAPGHERMEGEMARFLSWFNAPAPTDPVLRSAVAHLWFVSVTRGTSPHRCHSLPSMTFMQRL